MQSLLKAEAGTAVESWGGHGNQGRDAYTASRLKFPDLNILSEGPFVFQVKFVESANASGARPDQALTSAVAKEVARIQNRQRFYNSQNVRHYTLITNAVLSATVRQKLQELLLAALPTAELHLLGGNDVCDLLDQHTSLRRSFPQLLSIRDLDELLLEAVNHDIIEKSKSAVTIAKSVAEVFVPTKIYRWAWETLREHHLVVLEGPPEVGKTAIAWMVALGQLLNGWQIIVCDEPQEFFASLHDTQKQILSVTMLLVVRGMIQRGAPMGEST